MNISTQAFRRIVRKLSARLFNGCSLALALVFGVQNASSAADEIGATFATPEAAVAALVQATSVQNGDALRGLFGPAADELVNPDRIQATNEFNTFTAALNATNRLVPESDVKYVLEVGDNSWPFPIPLMKRADGQWFFDTEAGKEEILNRRIGRNELATLQSVRAYVDVQREYASRDRIGNGVLQFAQKIVSSPGLKDGLYWPTNLDGEISPLGPLVANAQAAGYAGNNANDDAKPFHGYYFKILTRQGKHAPGGKYDYVINGNMIGGFALVAWPAEYGNTGVMTFIVNQQGRVYQKDLGSKTDKLAPAMNQYDPDSSWQLSPN